MTDKRTISLANEQAAYVDGLVASGLYGSVSEVMRAGLRALKERDNAVESWLTNEVAPVYDRMLGDPESARSLDAVFDAVKKRHAQNLKRDV